MAEVNEEDGFTQLTKLNVTEELLLQGRELYHLADDGWAYYLSNTGTPENPANGDWRQQLQPHPSISNLTISVSERYNGIWAVVDSIGGSVASNGFSIWDGTEGFGYGNSVTPLQTLINIAPGLDGATIGTTTGDCGIVINRALFGLKFNPTTKIDDAQPDGTELITLPWDSETESYLYVFQFSESASLIEDSIKIHIDPSSNVTGATIRSGNLLPDGAPAIQNVSFAAFKAGDAQAAVIGENGITWEREIPMQEGVDHYGFIQSNSPLVLRGKTIGGIFVPQFSRVIHEVELVTHFALDTWEGKTYGVGDWIIEGAAEWTTQAKIYVCNTAGAQSGSFASNSALWDPLSSDTANDVPTIYTTDGTIDGDRYVGVLNSHSLQFFSANKTESDFDFIAGINNITTPSLGQVVVEAWTGDGAGNYIEHVSIDVSTDGVFVSDDVNNKPIHYTADYSSNLSDRAIPDYAAVKAYADSISIDTIYTADGVVDGDRNVLSNNGDFITLGSYDTEESTFNYAGGMTTISTNTFGQVVLEAWTGDGTGTYLDRAIIDVSTEGVFVSDDINNKPMHYTADYSSNLSDRAIPDYGLVQSRDNRTQMSGWLSGGMVTELDPNTVQVAAGTGVIVNNGDQTSADVSWEQTTVDVTGWDDEVFIVLVDGAGAISYQLFSSLTSDTYRDYIYLGSISITPVGVVQAVSTEPRTPAANPQAFMDFFRRVIGPSSCEGLIYSPNGSNLTIDQTQGDVFVPGALAHTTPNNMNFKTLAGGTAVNMATVINDGSGNNQSIDFGNLVTTTQWDDGSGTVATIPNNKWTVHRIFRGNTITVLALGQHIYDNYDDAVSGAVKDDFIEYGALSGVWFRAYLVVKKGTTDLSDTNKAEFLTAPNFRSTGVAGASGGDSDVTIYNSDGTVSSSRNVIAENEDYISLISYDTNESTFNYVGASQVNTTDTYGQVYLAVWEGDGAGAYLDRAGIDVTTQGIYLKDNINNKAAEYEVDYSASLTNRSIPDWEAVQTEISNNPTIFNTSGLIDSDRYLSGNDGKRLSFYSYDTNGTTFTYNARIQVNADSSVANVNLLVTDNGAADGSFSPSSGVRVNTDALRIQDDINSKGLIYDDDYSANYTDRSLVDKAYVDNKKNEYYQQVWAETAGNLSISGGGYQWSFGDGAISLTSGVSVYVPTGYTCEWVGMTWRGSDNTTDAKVGALVNEMRLEVFDIQAGSTTGTVDFTTPLSIVNGDAVSFTTTQVITGGIGPNNITAVLKFTET